MDIRVMKSEDYDKLYELWMTIKGFGIRSIDDSREGVTRFLKRNPTTSITAWDGDTLIGAILCGHDGRRGMSLSCVVRKGYRRQGVGKGHGCGMYGSSAKEQINKGFPDRIYHKMILEMHSGTRSAGQSGKI